MKSLVVAGMLMGIFFMRLALVYEPGGNKSKAEARALSFAAYRDAVHQYAFLHGEEGEIPVHALSLPAGLAAPAWSNRLARDEAGELLCYVYGSASSTEIMAIFALLKNSAALGWNNDGRLTGIAPGPDIALPAFIGNGDVVSVIALN